MKPIDKWIGAVHTRTDGSCQPINRPRSVGLIDEILDDPEKLPIVAGTAYDTAWLASVPDPSNPTLPRFPSSLDWLICQQLSNGSWGGAIRYGHDRVISTLAALVAVSRFDCSPE